MLWPIYMAHIYVLWPIYMAHIYMAHMWAIAEWLLSAYARFHWELPAAPIPRRHCPGDCKDKSPTGPPCLDSTEAQAMARRHAAMSSNQRSQLQLHPAAAALRQKLKGSGRVPRPTL
eukprot:COSAG04_NODE_4739_length_1917_cov_1.661166_1_plen_117_part_00